jgi:uncharacterized CHY-type Zn-finger protein
MLAYRYRERRDMAEALKDTGGLKETPIGRVLKDLKGKNLTKKKLFDFLADINIKDLCPPTENIPRVAPAPPEPIQEILPEEIKCAACMKIFASKGSLERHQARFTVCKEWIDHPQKAIPTNLTKGIHIIIGELLDKSICDGKLECKYCNTRFTNKGNHHKHYNTASVCNRMAYQEFKRLFSEFQT